MFSCFEEKCNEDGLQDCILKEKEMEVMRYDTEPYNLNTIQLQHDESDEDTFYPTPNFLFNKATCLGSGKNLH